MCDGCKQLYKTKIELIQHSHECDAATAATMLVTKTDEGEAKTKPMVSTASMEATLTRIRLLVAILLKKFSTPERLKQFGFEKWLIDNVVVATLKAAGKQYCEDEQITEGDRLRWNVRQFLEWMVPEKLMATFRPHEDSVEELLEKVLQILPDNEQ